MRSCLFRLGATLLASLSLLAPAAAQTEAFPSRPVTLVVPFPAGGSMDALARITATKLADAWGKPVLVDNMQASMAYMGLQPGQALAGLPVDRVFIGSCTNSRISDLRLAASIVRGRKVAPRVRAWVVPGSELVRRQAEAEGLAQVFVDAGFAWRTPGCSLCLGAIGETLASGERAVSTANRNFAGRQGPGSRTHIAGVALAAASALAGAIADPRDWLPQGDPA